MFRTYRTTNGTIMGEETERSDIKLKWITDVEGNEYVMVEKQEEHAIYDLSLIGYVTKIVDDVCFKEFRDTIYARFNKRRQH
ncbi:hypothetical protein [Pelosinus propionicus]|uniref:Uncharacterized protein n=1 Tax=Pelosinus propionicus DSM 13327 TaxID=1123291 RepID=A0A1I4JRN0_9FIRM|nr:hypothetical protein [Pelosinus propionicus]SFL69180.1 hypothetical protein SAMN04490355_1013119 [Pelosinus propionicus DSM 13327]